MRLQKFLALQKTNSRRKAEELISSGIVTINGNVAKLGTCIDPEIDSVAIDGISVSNKLATLHKKYPLVLVLNKPNGYVCSHEDRYNPVTIFNLIPKEFSQKKLMFCGRLDKSTEGMVILTDDGDFAQKLTHPSFGIKKHYEVILSCPLYEKVIKQTLKGIEDNGEFLKFDKIISTGSGSMKNFIFEVVLSHGKKNEIHRMFEHFAIFIKRLRRIRIGGLTLRKTPIGRCRRLSEQEIKILLNEKISKSKAKNLEKNFLSI